MMIDAEQAFRIAEAWIDAWNGRDINAIMAHYADDVEFHSPLIVKRMSIPDGKIVGKDLLRTYFARGLEVTPDLKFQLERVLTGVDSITIYYRRESGLSVAEVVQLDEAGKAINVRVHYSAPLATQSG